VLSSHNAQGLVAREPGMKGGRVRNRRHYQQAVDLGHRQQRRHSKRCGWPPVGWRNVPRLASPCLLLGGRRSGGWLQRHRAALEAAAQRRRAACGTGSWWPARVVSATGGSGPDPLPADHPRRGGAARRSRGGAAHRRSPCCPRSWVRVAGRSYHRCRCIAYSR
jgi:hypothetical protein